MPPRFLRTNAHQFLTILKKGYKGKRESPKKKSVLHAQSAHSTQKLTQKHAVNGYRKKMFRLWFTTNALRNIYRIKTRILEATSVRLLRPRYRVLQARTGAGW